MSTSRPPPSPPRVVVIGAGFGGLQAVRALAHAPVDVTVVDRRNHHLFQPLLYQVATAALSPGDIAYPIRSILRRQRNARVLLGEAVAVDPERREVEMRDGRLPYDYLILAAGSQDSYFGHDAWAPFAPGLKNIDDALEIRGRVLLAFERAERERDGARRAELLTFVLVGGGATGVELAGAIGEISRHVLASDFRSIDPREAKVLLLEAGPRILPAYDPRLSVKAAEELATRGVEVRTGAAVTDVGDGFVEAGGRTIRAATVLWTAGVAASPIAQSLGVPLDRAGRVLVASDLSIPGHPEIFVIGDLAMFPDASGRPLAGISPVAIQEGRHAAHNIERDLRGESRAPFRYFDKGILAVVGRSAAVAQVRGLRFWGFPAWLFWSLVHIFYLIGFRNRLAVMLDWAWAYATYKRGARLITGRPTEPR